MNPLRTLVAFARRRPTHVVYDSCYRLALAGPESGPDLRRADDALHSLLALGAVTQRSVITPKPMSYEALARVHTSDYLDRLQTPQGMADIFAIDPNDVVGDELLRTVRIVCGGTLAAAQATVASGFPALNLSGGFHHAAPDRGSGFCALNDVAVAVAALRADGFEGKIAVLDFDFHPPDGTSACLGADATVWLGSISGTSWGPLEGVDETVLPKGAGDTEYLRALSALLDRVPSVKLVFVLAGGDVLVGDRLGTLALSLNGVRRRDLTVAQRFAGVPQVWLPAGGYSPHAWKVVAGTGLALAFHSLKSIDSEADPLASRMYLVSRGLSPEALGDGPLSDDDIAESLGQPRRTPLRLLGFYTAEGLELALERFGFLPVVRRLGFDTLHIVLDRAGDYDRARLLGRDMRSGQEMTLVELEVERRRLGDRSFLFVNWLSLRNPRAHFSPLRPQLPGQEVPGLGLAREMSQLLGLMARRLVLDGVAFRPSWYHMAYAARHTAHFVAPERQGRFEALQRDLESLPLLEATRAVAGGRVRLNGAPYAWEADEMVAELTPRDDAAERAAIAAERERCHFTVAN